MSPLRVLTIFGTRPEAVKMAPVVQELERTSEVTSAVCVTAQHREMLDQVLHLFSIQPQYDLDIMQPDQSLAEVTAQVFSHLPRVLEAFQPDWVLVQGDTTTVMAAAVLSYYHRLRVGHVEAGLRTGDKWQPFPEEINRRVAGVVADLHFAPTETARQNLLQEGVPSRDILVTGNPVIDALHWVSEQPYVPDKGPLADLPQDRRVILVTVHRRENFGESMEDIFNALVDIAGLYPEEVHLVYPVHPNPNVLQPAQRILSGVSNISLLEPLEYLPMVHLMKRSTLILTDSGGLQEEAPALGVPVLVLRQVTERPEAVEAGTAKLVGTNRQAIVEQTQELLENPARYAAMAKAKNPFGDGRAAERIVGALMERTR